MSEAKDSVAEAPADARGAIADAARRRSAKSRRIAWVLAAIVALLYALAFVMNR